MEIVLFIVSLFLVIPSTTMAIDSHRNANWQKAQGLAYICSQDYIPPEFIDKCKAYKPPEKQEKTEFFLDQNKDK